MRGKKDPNKKSYIFDQRMMNFLEKELQYSKKVKKMNDEKYAGKDTTELQKEIDDKFDNRNTKKLRFLDQHIFRSMANLVTFFEFLVMHPELRDEYEDDIKELFGFIRGNTPIEKQSQANYNSKQNVWMRLIESILTWDHRNDPNNFRLEMLAELQSIIFYKFNIVSLYVLGDEATNNLVNNDIGKAKTWTKIFASKYKDSYWKNDQTKKQLRQIYF